MVRTDVDFPGANPDTAEAIRWTGGRLVVRPFAEDPAGPAYRFMLRFRLSVEESTPFTIAIDWDEPRYMRLRTILRYAELGSSDWRVLPGAVVGGTRCEFLFDQPPGSYEISLLPTYGLDRLNRLAEDCRDRVEVRIHGGTAETAGVHAFRLEGGGGRRPVIVAAGRLHPYETAGSYCLDGVVRRYAEDPVFAGELTRAFDWILVPVASPEGVRKGLCRYSGSGGLGYDNCRDVGPDDPYVLLLSELRRTEDVVGYLDIHNWMHEDRDGISYANCLDMMRFRRLLNAQRSHDKPWRVMRRPLCMARKTRGVMRVMQHAGAFCLALEYPWGGRTIEDMSRLGRASVLAFAGLVEKRQRNNRHGGVPRAGRRGKE
ncbi:M14 family zinc carboxypeptidase [Pseudodesulfovibrio karagichevae]|uniref:M14 family zinc carboxypeptidase n=1 Tax=Pseudodesulfovibrio karagichevae TaxID=3239305 RepID=A0ABV4K313_9BACT